MGNFIPSIEQTGKKEMKHGMRYKGELLILGTAFLWSFLGIVTKGISYHGMTVAGMTSMMAALVLLSAYRQKALMINGRVLFTGIVLAVMNLTFILANKYTTVANAIVLQYTSPIFVILYYRIFQRRRLKKMQVGTVAVCFVGLLVFFAGQLGNGNLCGNLLALVSGIFFAGGFYLDALPGSNPAASNFLSNVICTGVGLCYTLVYVEQDYNIKTTALTLLAGFLCSGVAAVAYARGIRYTTALNANLIAMLEVLLAPLWALLFFGETIGTWAGLGAGLMTASILYETWFESRTKEI